MGFIPEDREERKWFIRIGISLLSIGLFFICLFLFYLYYISTPLNLLTAFLLFSTCLFIVPFILGFLYGKWMPFQATKSRDLCLKGGLFIELLLLIPFILNPKWILLLATYMAIFGLIFYFLILLIPVVFCGLGSYYGAQHREKRSKKR